MRGRYLDVIRSPDGVSRFPWRSNLVVDRCYPLLARLMRSETPLAGVAYLAVGRGGTGSGPSRSDVGLQDEIYRQRIAPGDLRFLDASGAPTPQPTSTLSIRAVIGGAELGAMPGVPQTLNEFGLFGGEATEDAGSGTLINRVVHDPHVLSVDAVLERRIELDFGETAAERSRVALTESMWVESGTVGSFGEFLPLRAIDGIGPNNRRAFLRAGLGTVDALARQDPLRPLPEFDPNEFRELVTKARLVRRLRVPRSSEALSGRRVLEVGATEPTELVSWSSGQLDLTSARTLQHALSVLEVALDRDAFEALTIGDLVAIPPMWTAPGERGPFGADLAVDAVQGVGKVLRERLIAAGRATLDELAFLPMVSLTETPAHHLREIVTKARLVRHSRLPGHWRALGPATLDEVMVTPAPSLVERVDGASLGEASAVLHALMTLELALDQSTFRSTRLQQLVALGR